MLKRNTVRCLWMRCDKEYETEDECYKHLVSHTLPGKFTCQWQTQPNKPVCGANIRHKGIMCDHSVTHFSYDLRPFFCSLCPLSFRNVKCRKNHHVQVHKDVINNSQITKSTSLNSVYCDIGNSREVFELVVSDMQKANYTIPFSFFNALENVRKYGGRVHPGILLDDSAVNFQFKHFNIIDTKSPFVRSSTRVSILTPMIPHIYDNKPKSDIVVAMTSVIKSTLLPAFQDSKTKFQVPSIGLAPLKPHNLFRSLIINLFKLHFEMMKNYNNQDIMTLIESTEFELSQSVRIGVRISILFEMKEAALFVRKGSFILGLELFAENCQEIVEELFPGYAINLVITDKGQRDIYIWATGGLKAIVDRVPTPSLDEKYQILGFSI